MQDRISSRIAEKPGARNYLRAISKFAVVMTVFLAAMTPALPALAAAGAVTGSVIINHGMGSTSNETVTLNLPVETAPIGNQRLPDGDMEGSEFPWQSQGTGGTIAKDSVTVKFGSQSLRVEEGSGGWKAARQNLAVTAGEELVLTVWSYSDRGAARIQIYDPIYHKDLVNLYPSGDGWIRSETTFRISAGTTSLQIWLYANGVGAKVYYDQVGIGQNRISNSGLEWTYNKGLAPGWSLSGAPLVEESVEHADGTKSQRVNVNAAYTGIYQGNVLTGNKWHMLTGWLRVHAGTVRFGNVDSAGAYLDVTETENGGVWRKYSLLVPPGTNGTIQVYAATDAADFLVDGVVAYEISGPVQVRISTDGGANWGSWQDYRGTLSTEVPTGDGLKTVSVQFRDAVGNLSSVASSTILLDTNAPTGSVAAGNGSGYTTATTTVLDLSVSEEAAGGNRVADGNMESPSYSAWLNQGTGTLAKDTATVRFGSQSLRVQESGGTWKAARQNIAVTAGEELTLSVWSLAVSGVARIQIYDRVNGTNVVNLYPTGSAWTNSAISFKVPAGVSSLEMWLYANGSGAQVHYDQISLWRNNVANGGMEGAFSNGLAAGWVAFGTPAASESTAYHSGTRAQRIQAPVSGHGIYQPGALSVNKWYLMSAWLKVSAGTVRIGAADTPGSFLDVSAAANGGVWRQYGLLIHPTVNGNIQVYGLTADSDFLVDDVVIYEAPGPVQVRTSLDGGATWGVWQDYRSDLPVTLPAGDGTKSITVQLKDGAGNLALLGATTVLDATVPAGVISIAGGAATTVTTSVTVDMPVSEATVGGNRLADGDMEEAGYSVWINQGTGTLAKDTTTVRFGSQSLRVQASGGTWKAARQNVAVTPGEELTLSAWSNTVSGAARIQIYDRSNGTNVADLYPTSSGWVKSETSFQVPPGVSTLEISFYANGTGARVHYDQISLWHNNTGNGGMEKVFTNGLAYGWTVLNTPALSESTVSHSGARAQRIQTPAPSGGMYQSAVMSVNKWYLMSAWLKVTAGKARIGAVNNPGSSYLDVTAADNGGVWRPYSLLLHPTVNGNIHVYSPVAGSDFLVDDVAVYEVPGPVQTRISNNWGATWGVWQDYKSSRPVTLSAGDGTKAVSVQFRDGAGNVNTATDTIILDTQGNMGTVAPAQGSTAGPGGSLVFTVTSEQATAWSALEWKSAAESTWQSTGSGGAVTSPFTVNWPVPTAPGQYDVRVRVTDANGSVGYTRITALTLPATPVVTVSDGGQGDIHVSWTAGDGNAFTIARSSDAAFPVAATDTLAEGITERFWHEKFNGVGNGSFEETQNNSLMDWAGGCTSCTVDNSTSRWGTASLKISGEGAIGQSVFLGPGLAGRPLAASGWFKTQTVSGTGARLSMRFLDRSGVELGEAASLPLMGTADWQYVTVTGWVPVDVWYMEVWLSLSGGGTLWADGVQVLPASVPGNSGFSPEMQGQPTYYYRVEAWNGPLHSSPGISAATEPREFPRSAGTWSNSR